MFAARLDSSCRSPAWSRPAWTTAPAAQYLRKLPAPLRRPFDSLQDDYRGLGDQLQVQPAGVVVARRVAEAGDLEAEPAIVGRGDLVHTAGIAGERCAHVAPFTLADL